MKTILNWQSAEVVNIYDEVSLWSAHFGNLLLDNIPMHKQTSILDLGFGTGFPLIELSQRFGNDTTVYGIDIWKEGIARTKEKINVLQQSNIQLIEHTAAEIPLPNNSVDLITSNLGINNFDDKKQVIKECYRVLKEEGSLCLTTNPIGTFNELYELFIKFAKQLKNNSALEKIEANINHRGTFKSITKDFKDSGFTLSKKIEDSCKIRFSNAKAVFDYALIRIGFRATWDNFFPEELNSKFYNLCEIEIDKIIKVDGEFNLTIPIMYFEFRKI